MGQDGLESLILIFTKQEYACKLDLFIIYEFNNVIAFKSRLSLQEIFMLLYNINYNE
jgi:hypothetical protein